MHQVFPPPVVLAAGRNDAVLKPVLDPWVTLEVWGGCLSQSSPGELGTACQRAANLQRAFYKPSLSSLLISVGEDLQWSTVPVASLSPLGDSSSSSRGQIQLQGEHEPAVFLAAPGTVWHRGGDCTLRYPAPGTGRDLAVSFPCPGRWDSSLIQALGWKAFSSKAEEGWDPLSPAFPGRYLTPEPPSLCPTACFMALPVHLLVQSNFNRNILTSGHPRGCGRSGISLLQGGRGLPCFKGVSPGDGGEGEEEGAGEWKNPRATSSHRDQAPQPLQRVGGQIRTTEQRVLGPFSLPHPLHHAGVSPALPRALPRGCVSNAAERRARLPAAVWRGAMACLFPGCLPALLLHASGFLAVVVVVVVVVLLLN